LLGTIAHLHTTTGNSENNSYLSLSPLPRLLYPHHPHPHPRQSEEDDEDLEDEEEDEDDVI